MSTIHDNPEHVLTYAIATLRESAKQHRLQGDNGHATMCDALAEQIETDIATAKSKAQANGERRIRGITKEDETS